MPRRHHVYYVYILANKHRTVLYVGVTNDIRRRVREHRQHRSPTSFTARYRVTHLLYAERYRYVNDAIRREKQIKKGPRRRKEALIDGINPEWRDLATDW